MKSVCQALGRAHQKPRELKVHLGHLGHGGHARQAPDNKKRRQERARMGGRTDGRKEERKAGGRNGEAQELTSFLLRKLPRGEDKLRNLAFSSQ